MLPKMKTWLAEISPLFVKVGWGCVSMQNLIMQNQGCAWQQKIRAIDLELEAIFRNMVMPQRRYDPNFIVPISMLPNLGSTFVCVLLFLILWSCSFLVLSNNPLWEKCNLIKHWIKMNWTLYSFNFEFGNPFEYETCLNLFH